MTVCDDKDGRALVKGSKRGRYDKPFREVFHPGRQHLTVTYKFQSDKYKWCDAGYLPLKIGDPMAEDLLRIYARRRQTVDPQFTQDLIDALARFPKLATFDEDVTLARALVSEWFDITTVNVQFEQSECLQALIAQNCASMSYPYRQQLMDAKKREEEHKARIEELEDLLQLAVDVFKGIQVGEVVIKRTSRFEVLIDKIKEVVGYE